MTLFSIGEFEHSLVHAHRGYQKYPITFLQHGILQGSEAIEDCIGSDTEPRVLQLLSPWIRELDVYRNLLIERLKEEVDELAGTKNQRQLSQRSEFPNHSPTSENANRNAITISAWNRDISIIRLYKSVYNISELICLYK